MILNSFTAILIISFGATFLSSMSGAGAAMITVPIWLMMGYPLPVAQAASKINGMLWTPIAARNYLRSIRIDLPLIVGLTFFGLVGAYFGSISVIAINPEIIKKFIGSIIIVLVILVFIRRDFGQAQTPAHLNRNIASLLSLPLGFYEGFFGSGNGLFTSSMLAYTRGFDLISSLGYYYVMSFFWCALSSAIFLSLGYGDIGLILPSSIGGMAGAYIGSLIGKRQGNGFVKYAFVSIGAVLGLKLVFGL